MAEGATQRTIPLNWSSGHSSSFACLTAWLISWKRVYIPAAVGAFMPSSLRQGKTWVPCRLMVPKVQYCQYSAIPHQENERGKNRRLRMTSLYVRLLGVSFV